jgi:nitrogen-specific signal transduction histidine kinase
MLHRLMRQSSTGLPGLLDEVVVTCLALCDAQSAGICLEEMAADGSKVLRWVAVDGRLADLCGHIMPREAIDGSMPQLLVRPNLALRSLEESDVAEALVVPWRVGHYSAGALWVMQHAEANRFDREDLRMLLSLVSFAQTAMLKEQVEAERRAQDAARSVDQLANRLAHALNNPLQAITNSLFLIDAGGCAEHLRDAKLQLERMNGLVRAILEPAGPRKRVCASVVSHETASAVS